jgi:hypothetical protein
MEAREREQREARERIKMMKMRSQGSEQQIRILKHHTIADDRSGSQEEVLQKRLHILRRLGKKHVKKYYTIADDRSGNRGEVLRKQKTT